MASVRQRKCARRLFATLQGPQGEQLAQDLGMKGDTSFKQVLAFLVKKESDLLGARRAESVKSVEGSERRSVQTA